MRDADFHYVTVSTLRERLPLWRVHLDSPDGPYLGTVKAQAGGFLAEHITQAGNVLTDWFADRRVAAQWLLDVAPRRGRGKLGRVADDEKMPMDGMERYLRD